MSIFNVSQSAADLIFNIANTVLIAGAALVLLGTIAVVWSSGLRERFADIRIRENETKTAEANAQAAKANAETARLSADAEQSRKEIADANERAAKADQKAAEAVLALAKIKTPRTLTEAQKDGIIRNLKPLAGQKYSLNVFSDAESINLMRSLDATLQAAGWVRIPPQIGVMVIDNAGDASNVGLFAAIKRESPAGTHQNLEIAVQAFALAGLSFTKNYVAELKALDAINFNIGQKPVN